MTHLPPMRVFVNGRGLDVDAGATALDAVRAFDPEAAEAVSRGERVVTDSRGLPSDVAVPIQAGAIFRVLPKRERTSALPDDDTGIEAP
jgi:hypothetical protein